LDPEKKMINQSVVGNFQQFRSFSRENIEAWRRLKVGDGLVCDLTMVEGVVDCRDAKPLLELRRFGWRVF
jgi:hypothetical protein